VRTYLEVRIDELPPRADYRRWCLKYLDFACGRINADELVRAAGRSRIKLSDDHFLIGLRHLSQKDRAGARDQFEKCVATEAFMIWEWQWARAFLARMGKDAAWPP